MLNDLAEAMKALDGKKILKMLQLSPSPFLPSYTYKGKLTT